MVQVELILIHEQFLSTVSETQYLQITFCILRYLFRCDASHPARKRSRAKAVATVFSGVQSLIVIGSVLGSVTLPKVESFDDKLRVKLKTGGNESQDQRPGNCEKEALVCIFRLTVWIAVNSCCTMCS